MSPPQDETPTTTPTKSASTTNYKPSSARQVIEVIITSPKRSKEVLVTATTVIPSATTDANMEVDQKDETPPQAVDPDDQLDLCDRCVRNPDRKCKYCGCWECGGKEDEENTLACDECGNYFHMKCLDPPLTEIPEGDWYVTRIFKDSADTQVLRLLPK